MFTVALIGADGAGKTTVARRLEERLPFPATYLYMGDNPDSVSHQLPVTRALWSLRRRRGKEPAAGPPSPDSHPQQKTGRHMRLQRRTVDTARLVLALAEEWYRQIVVWRLLRRGRVVIFDRHFFADYYAHHVMGDGRRLSQRIHGIVLDRLYPKPDLTVLLDAPAEVLHRRKAEGTLDALERRRREYLDLVPRDDHFALVDAARPLPAVEEAVLDTITRFARLQPR